MSKLLSVMIAGLFTAGAYAQNPAGTSSEQQPVLNSKSQNRAQTRVEARPQGKVKQPAGDRSNSEEVNPIASGGKAAAAGQKRANAKPQGVVKQPAGDRANTEEINPVASGGKPAAAGQARVEARDAKAAAKK